MLPLFFRPGQQWRKFTIYRKKTNVDSRGRVIYSTEHEPVGTFSGTIVQANQSEQMKWSQMGHPITHRVVVRGAIDAQAEDYIALNGRFWSVQGKHDPMEIAYFHTLYCDERKGVGK